MWGRCPAWQEPPWAATAPAASPASPKLPPPPRAAARLERPLHHAQSPGRWTGQRGGLGVVPARLTPTPPKEGVSCEQRPWVTFPALCSQDHCLVTNGSWLRPQAPLLPSAQAAKSQGGQSTPPPGRPGPTADQGPQASWGCLSWRPGGQEAVRETLRCFNQIPQQPVQLGLDHTEPGAREAELSGCPSFCLQVGTRGNRAWRQAPPLQAEKGASQPTRGPWAPQDARYLAATPQGLEHSGCVTEATDTRWPLPRKPGSSRPGVSAWRSRCALTGVSWALLGCRRGTWRQSEAAPAPGTLCQPDKHPVHREASSADETGALGLKQPAQVHRSKPRAQLRSRLRHPGRPPGLLPPGAGRGTNAPHLPPSNTWSGGPLTTSPRSRGCARRSEEQHWPPRPLWLPCRRGCWRVGPTALVSPGLDARQPLLAGLPDRPPGKQQAL